MPLMSEELRRGLLSGPSRAQELLSFCSKLLLLKFDRAALPDKLFAYSAQFSLSAELDSGFAAAFALER